MTDQAAQPHLPALDCFATACRMIDRAVSSVYDDALRPYGIRSTQMALLFVLDRTSSPGKTMTATDLAGLMHIDKSTLSRGLDRLIEAGWIAVGESEDARAQPLSVTRSGKRLIEKVQPAWQDAQQQTLELLGKNTAEAMLTAASSLMNQPPG